MKILFIAQRFHINMYYPAKALVQDGFEVRFWTMYEQMSEMHDVVAPEILKRSWLDKIFKKIAGRSDFWKTKIAVPAFFALGLKLFKYKPDVILIKDTQNFLSIFMLVWCAILRKKSYLLIQTDNYRVRGLIKRGLVWLLKNIAGVRGVISPLKDRSGSPDPFFTYIPFVCEAKKIEKEYSGNGRINIIDVGKFQKRKDHLRLIKAVSSLKEKYDIYLMIVGEKMDVKIEDEIYQYISANKLDGTAEVFVSVQPKEMPKIYAGGDLYVLPSYDEPAAYSVVEAMAHGLPVIVSDTCGTRCYIEEGKNGYIFKSKNADDLAEKIELAIKDRRSLAKLSEKSYELALAKHSLQVFLDDFKKIIK